MNPDHCSAMHTHVASFCCELKHDHEGDHFCRDNQGKPITWSNFPNGYLRRDAEPFNPFANDAR